MKDVKKDSSSWIKTKGSQFRNFHWQDGYGAFSIGKSDIPELKRYIAGQKEHHRKHSFQEELIEFLEEYGIAYDERYFGVESDLNGTFATQNAGKHRDTLFGEGGYTFRKFESWGSQFVISLRSPRGSAQT